MKTITRQLVIGTFILALVTVASLGIRHIHFSDNRAGTIESPVIVETEHDRLLAELDAIVTEPDTQYADALDAAEEVSSEDYSEAKPSKGDYAKAKGSKGLQKIFNIVEIKFPQIIPSINIWKLEIINVIIIKI